MRHNFADLKVELKTKVVMNDLKLAVGRLLSYAGIIGFKTLRPQTKPGLESTNRLLKIGNSTC